MLIFFRTKEKNYEIPPAKKDSKDIDNGSQISVQRRADGKQGKECYQHIMR